MDYSKVRRGAFDSFGGNSYDPQYFTQEDTISTNQYDPNYADAPSGGGTTQVFNAKAGQKMQINLTLNNPTAQRITFDLFNAFFNSVDILKPELVIGNYSRIPGLSFEGQAAYPNNIDIYDQNGALMIRGNGGDPTATIGCSEYPYKSLVDTTKVLGFKIVVIRVSVATQAQFDNNIFYKLKTYAGVTMDNTINVRSYKRLINPAQLDIDVKAGVIVTGESGLYYTLETGERVQLGLYINKWAKPSI